MTRYLIALGSSHPRGGVYFEKTKQHLCKKNIFVVGESSLYKNNSVGTSYNCLFYNCVLAVLSPSHPHVFYRELRAIEHALGRIRTYRNSRRCIDIDVLLSLDIVYKSSSLFIPHKDAWERNFFVIPALEALKSASWPKPLVAAEAGAKFAKGYLQKSRPCFDRFEKHKKALV